MEFDLQKGFILIMKSRKRKKTEGMELPNQEKISSLGEKENYKYLEILEADTFKHAKMKEKWTRDIIRTRKLLETKLCSRNLIKRNKQLDRLPSKKLQTILKMNKGGTHRTDHWPNE